ncbi:MAG: hypothetical protein KBA06_02010, partial [Saprospiraceae bacterium]|nr:hypothetical protein [Saprospiraceae bacterium]
MKKSHILSFAIIWFFTFQNNLVLGQSNPIEIGILNVTSPMVTVSGLRDQVRFSLINRTSQPVNAIIRATFEGLSGDARGIMANAESYAPIEIPANYNAPNTSMTGIGAEFPSAVLEGGDYNITTENVEQRNAIDAGYFPPGSYRICIYGIDPVTQDVISTPV